MSTESAALATALAEHLAGLATEQAAEELLKSGERFSKYLSEALSGYQLDLAEQIDEKMPGTAGQIIALGGIEFVSTCAHHLLPFYGKIDLVYQVGAHIAGLGGLNKLIEALAARLQIQEQLAQQLSAELISLLGAQGALVRVTAKQDCLSARTEAKSAEFTVVATAGSLDQPEQRTLALQLLGQSEASASTGSISSESAS